MQLDEAGELHLLNALRGLTLCEAEKVYNKPKKASSTRTATPSSRFINEKVQKVLAAKRPVVTVDTRKKELVPNYRNAGRQEVTDAELRPSPPPQPLP